MLRILPLVGAAALCAVACAHAATCDAFGFGNRLPRLVNSRLAARTTLLCNRNYASLNSELAHEPLWSAPEKRRTRSTTRSPDQAAV
ncbi:MAG: hypothetical protein ABF479_10010 [Gluconacetobacter sp.]